MAEYGTPSDFKLVAVKDLRSKDESMDLRVATVSVVAMPNVLPLAQRRFEEASPRDQGLVHIQTPKHSTVSWLSSEREL